MSDADSALSSSLARLSSSASVLVYVQPPSPSPAFIPSTPLVINPRLSPATLSSSQTARKRRRTPCPASLQCRRLPRVQVVRSVTEVEPPQRNATAAANETSSSAVPPPSATPAASLDVLLQPRDARRFVFFGGKGGVGKTTSSAAAALRCADEGLTTLIISTDPAHSLGDALQLDLSDGRVCKVDDALPLYAIESDTREAVERFRQLLSSLSPSAPPPDASAASVRADGGATDSDAAGWAAVADKLGLQEFSQVLDTVPPGADELIALVSVLDLVESDSPDIVFDRVIIDTAPTGHTLRLLAFPDFLDKFLTQALSLRERLASARGIIGNVTKMFMGGGLGSRVDVDAAVSAAAERVVAYRDKMVVLSELFRDPSRTEFVVVTIATVLAVEESKRLIERLWDEGIWVRRVVVNQILPGERHATLDKYLQQVRKGQATEISFATEQIADEFGLSISLVPRFDTEVRGVYGLQALGQMAFKAERRGGYGRLFDEAVRAKSGDESQFVFVGGKGGVGKTSVSSALGMTLANMGFKTLMLSTDPAHSLGDALQMQLEGGVAVPVNGVQGGELFAMEIDTQGAIENFQRLAKEFVAEGRKGAGVDIARKLGLEEFASLLDNAPPGIDELVALTEVIEVVKFGDFDRVVVDTAPTGHTLRLLSFPEFLDEFLGKVVRLKQRLDSGIEALRNVLGRKESADAVDKAARGIERLRENMVELKRLVGDGERTQFAIVTVPTGLAMAESERLVKSLRKDEMRVRNLIINQIVPDGSTGAFVERIVNDQQKCIEDLRAAASGKRVSLVKVPFFDVEVRGIYGLRAMAESLFSVRDDS